MPNVSSTAPVNPVRTPIIQAEYDGGTGTGNSGAYGDASFTITGASNVRELDKGVQGLTLEPGAGADQVAIMSGANGGQSALTQALAILQGNDIQLAPAWTLTYQLPIVPALVSNAAQPDTWIGFGFWLDSAGFLFSRPRGRGVILQARGDGGANWRAYAQDDSLGGAGSVTLDVDTGIAFTPGDVQVLALQVGSDGAAPFFRFLVDGVVAYDPTLPVATGILSTNPTTWLGPVVLALRGSDAADQVAPIVLDQPGPQVWVDTAFS